MTGPDTHQDSIAIVGMDVAWAGCDGLDAFTQLIFEGDNSTESGSAQRGFQAAGERLLEKVSLAALRDAGIWPGGPQLRIVFLFAWSKPVRFQYDWAARVMDLSDRPNPIASALENAERLLLGGEADVVLYAAGAGAGDVPEDNLPGRNAGLGFDRDAHGWRPGEGAGAVVWMRSIQAQQEGRRIYAALRGWAAAAGKGTAPEAAWLPTPPSVEDVRGCCQTALERAGVSPEQIGYLEAFACGADALDAIEISGMVQAYRPGGPDLTTALGSAQALTGYLGTASGLAGFVQAALCLYQRSLPGATGWSAPKLPALWRGAPFYVPGESRPWFQKRSGAGRLAALSVIGRGGAYAHLIMSEPAPHQAQQPARGLPQAGCYLFPLIGDDQDALLRTLAELRLSLTGGAGLMELAGEYYLRSCAAPAAAYGLSLVGRHAEEILREVDLAVKAIPGAFEKGTAWQTPLGSTFTPTPAGPQGGVALVYPGAFNSYPGVGKDLFRLFPELYAVMDEVSADAGQVMRERLIYPRSLAAITKEEMAARETTLLADPIAMLVSGAALAVLYTHILTEIFQVRPAAAFGYSLGENSMLFASGLWGQGDQASARLAESEVFRSRLAGAQMAIREYWGVPAEEHGAGAPLWNNYLVMTTPEKVQAALEKTTRVYMTHINTPRQVVIGGDPQNCRRVLEELRCPSLQAPFDYALHCEAIRSEGGALAWLHDWPVEKAPDLRMYSAADYNTLNFDQVEISHKIAGMLVSPLDFPRLVQKVYADGARVFIEAGAGSNCARWVDETLKDLPHMALSLDRRGTDDFATLVRSLARLHSHRVPVNLAALYQPAMERTHE